MREEIDQALAEMVTRGLTPAAIVMTPPQMKRLMAECSPQDHLYHEGSEGSGWKYENLPIYRSWHMTGPCVVERELLTQLRRYSPLSFENGPFDPQPEPLLF